MVEPAFANVKVILIESAGNSTERRPFSRIVFGDWAPLGVRFMNPNRRAPPGWIVCGLAGGMDGPAVGDAVGEVAGVAVGLVGTDDTCAEATMPQPVNEGLVMLVSESALLPLFAMLILSGTEAPAG